jgi:hypothetical protein
MDQGQAIDDRRPLIRWTLSEIRLPSVRPPGYSMTPNEFGLFSARLIGRWSVALRFHRRAGTVKPYFRLGLLIN